MVLTLVIWQPRGLSIGWTAAVGGILALVLGIVSWANVGEVVGIVWDATLTFVAVILISLILDAAGFFEWAALWMARASHGRGVRLFLWLGILGALVAMFFANDGAALILTPIVIAEIRALGLSPRATLALVMAGGIYRRHHLPTAGGVQPGQHRIGRLLPLGIYPVYGPYATG